MDISNILLKLPHKIPFDIRVCQPLNYLYLIYKALFELLQTYLALIDSL